MLTLTDPFLFILPAFISSRRGDNGAWQMFERGQIALWDFYVTFGQELSDTVLGNAWYREYCALKGIGERTFFTFVVLSPFTDVRSFHDPKKIMTLHCRTTFFPVLPTGRISDCPKLPEKLEIDGRDVSARRAFGYTPVRSQEI